MTRKQKIIMFAVVWGIALAVALFMHFVGSVNIWLALAIVSVAWLANGVLAEWEDRRPGRFLTPPKPP